MSEHNSKTTTTTATDGAGADAANGGAAHRSGFVAVVGRPNVGKSTLMNAMLGTQVAITSSRPETTRKAIRGILTLPDAQMVIVDTPGIHRPRTVLGERLNDMVESSLADADAIAFLLPADQPIGPGDKRILQRLRMNFSEKKEDGSHSWRVPVIGVVTKIDKVPRRKLVDRLMEIDRFGQFTDMVPVSAITRDNVDEVVRVLVAALPEGPQLYPDEQISEESRESQIAELVRGVMLEELSDELPHSLAVVVDSIEYPDDGGEGDGSGETGDADGAASVSPPEKAHVHISVYVERPSQKPIVIGRKAEHIVRVKKKLRTPVNRIVGRKSDMDIHVKVARNWQSDPKQLDRLGFI